MNKEIVSKLGIKRERGFLYFIRGVDIWKAPMSRADQPSVAGKAEKVADGKFQREGDYLYFLNSEGNVARVQRRTGGQTGAKYKRKAR